MPRLALPTSPTLSIASLLPTSSTPCAFIYASHPRWPLLPGAQSSPQRIRVVDSSWNPPHAAHLALARHGARDATLLAFTVLNPDKGSVKDDVTALRLEMVRAVALDLQRRAERGEEGLANVAVAVLQAPTFVQKSRILKSELYALAQEHGASSVEGTLQLSFAVGWDTLIRIFAPRYYQPPNPDLTTSMNALLVEDGSFLSCARRGDVSPEEEHAFLESPEVKPWAQQVELFDLEDEHVRSISSTEIRRAVKDERWDDVRRDVPFEGVVEVLQREGLYRE
ncbi:hypothetical protein JCM6882_007195 [Rhodosporidiobolus microsporus]